MQRYEEFTFKIKEKSCIYKLL